MITLVFIRRERLTDGSYGFNVQLGEFEWKAVTEQDADKLAQTIVAAVNAHTVDGLAEVVYE
jgi:hypothetical protein